MLTNTDIAMLSTIYDLVVEHRHVMSIARLSELLLGADDPAKYPYLRRLVAILKARGHLAYDSHCFACLPPRTIRMMTGSTSVPRD